MKQAVNFQLSQHTVTVLSFLEKKLHTSRTNIVERALHLYAKKELKEKNTLLDYAGILNEKEASSMLETIKSSRHNKTLKIKL